MKRWSRRLGLLAGGSLLALLLLEGGLRLYSAWFFPRLMTTEARLGWRHSADRRKVFTNEDGERNLVVLNEHGHRGRPPGERREGRFRVLVLGDSFTEAVQVSETQVFTALLERADPSLELLNAGVGAWGTVQQLLYLRDHGLAFEPDLVLVMAYENDLVDSSLSYSPGIGPRPWARLVDGEVQVVEQVDEREFLRFVAPVPFRSFLSRNSYLFYAFNERVWQRLRREEHRRLEDADRLAIDGAESRAIFLGLIGEMRRAVSERGGRLALGLIPSAGTVRAGRSEWHEEVVAAARRDGLPCLSLVEALATAEERGRRCYFERDIHWTWEGHEVAAEALLPWLRAARTGPAR